MKSYIGPTGNAILLRYEWMNTKKIKRIEKSTVGNGTCWAKYRNSYFNDIKVINEEENYEKHLIKEAVDIERDPINLNREEEWKVNKA